MYRTDAKAAIGRLKPPLDPARGKHAAVEDGGPPPQSHRSDPGYSVPDAVIT
jgi:hypothetical protein